MRASFALQVEESMTDNEIDDRHHGTHDSEMDRSEIIIGMEVGLESGHSRTGVLELGLPRNDGFNKVKSELYLRESQYARWVLNAFWNFVLLQLRIALVTLWQ